MFESLCQLSFFRFTVVLDTNVLEENVNLLVCNLSDWFTIVLILSFIDIRYNFVIYNYNHLNQRYFNALTLSILNLRSFYEDRLMFKLSKVQRNRFF